MKPPAMKSRVLDAENAGWTELHRLIDLLTPEQAERPGFYDEGWTAKDMLAHIGAWLAEAGLLLERIAVGTYRRDEIDIDSMNERFLELMKDIDFDTAKAQSAASRARMRLAYRELPKVTPDADWWVEKSGPVHYKEHLPRLKEWVDELRARPGR